MDNDWKKLTFLLENKRVRSACVKVPYNKSLAHCNREINKCIYGSIGRQICICWKICSDGKWDMKRACLVADYMLKHYTNIFRLKCSGFIILHCVIVICVSYYNRNISNV